jgi:hypothetical protein
MTLSITTFRITTHSINDIFLTLITNDTQQNKTIIMLSAIMLSAIMMSVIMLSVIVLSVAVILKNYTRGL